MVHLKTPDLLAWHPAALAGAAVCLAFALVLPILLDTAGGRSVPLSAGPTDARVVEREGGVAAAPSEPRATPLGRSETPSEPRATPLGRSETWKGEEAHQRAMLLLIVHGLAGRLDFSRR